MLMETLDEAKNALASLVANQREGEQSYIRHRYQNPNAYEVDTSSLLPGGAYTVASYDSNGNMTTKASGERVSFVMNGGEYRWGVSFDRGLKLYKKIPLTAIIIDGKIIDSCGDTIVLEEQGLEASCDYAYFRLAARRAAQDTVNTEDAIDMLYCDRHNCAGTLTLNDDVDFFDKKRICCVRSRDGVPIKAYAGDAITHREVRHIPKMMEVIIDGKHLYIHRANFQIIDAELLR